MKFTFFAFLLLSILACNSKSRVHYESRCHIRFDSLFKTVDTTKLQIVRNTDSAAIEVLDQMSKHGERGLFRFDKNKHLRFYTFLSNTHNDATFFLTYDSLGKRTRRSSSEVVEWTFYSPKDSTEKFTFYLCALDRNYGDIEIKSGKFRKDNITLYQSNFTKLICANISLNKSDMDSTRKIYITGNWQEKCSKKQQLFIDSVVAPQ